MIQNKRSFFTNKDVQRRVLHVAGGLFVGYYVIPDPLLYSFSKQWILFIIGLIVLFIEIYRQKTKKPTCLEPLLREYEESRPASFSYFAIGSVLLLYVFPQYITIPCILSTAICDPLIGIMKQKNKRKIGYIIGFFVSFIFFSITWLTTTVWILCTASLIGSSGISIAEYIANPILDDDFLMQVLPALFLSVLSYILLRFSLMLPNQLIYALW
jgi:dolichol kinase